MNKKSIIALTSAAVLTLGMTIGSYAWFTDRATSTANSFKTGTLGITAVYNDTAFAGQINIQNLQPGDSKTYTFTVNNHKSNGNVSSLDLKYRNDITNDNFATDHSLLIPATFNLAITGTHSESYQNIDFATLKDKLDNERTFTGGTDSTDTYTITINIPTATGNEYQDKTGTFKIQTRAAQTVTGAQYEDLQ